MKKYCGQRHHKRHKDDDQREGRVADALTKSGFRLKEMQKDEIREVGFSPFIQCLRYGGLSCIASLINLLRRDHCDPHRMSKV